MANKEQAAKIEVATTSAAPDEMAEIMNEIESLQQEMNRDSTSTAPVTAADGVPAPGKNAAGVDLKLVSPFRDGMDDVPEPDHSDLNEQGMHEFAGDEGDSSLEETLAGLEAEGSTGKSLLDVDSQESSESSESSDSDAPMTAPTPIRSFPNSKKQNADSREDSMKAATSTVHDPDQAPAGTLSMQLAGNMTLSLKYEVEGQEVTIGFKDGSLRVELADGTEFKIPLKR